MNSRARLLTRNASLATASRFATRLPAEDSVARWEIGLLLVIGVVSGAFASLVKLRLGIPGHAILVCVPPAALGVALIPRRLSGTLIGGAAMLTMLALGRTGTGAMAGMLATGVLLDLALRWARPGVSVYLALVASGVGANLVAFAFRGGAKLAGDLGTAGSFARWWSHALVAYALTGALAGLVSAVAWFHLRARRSA